MYLRVSECKDFGHETSLVQNSQQKKEGLVTSIALVV